MLLIGDKFSINTEPLRRLPAIDTFDMNFAKSFAQFNLHQPISLYSDNIST